VTHSEILTKMDDYDIGLSNGMAHKDLVFATAKALRAVVELHKPEHSITGYRCTHCTLEVTYPCPTIQAIEKELQ